MTNLSSRWPQHVRRRVSIAILALILGLGGNCSVAAPVTLQFNTTVANTFGLPLGPIETSSSLPFSISAGDPLTVAFTYEAWSGTGTYVQSGLLRATIGSETLLTPFQIVVRNDVFGLIDMPGRIVGTAPNVDSIAFYVDQTAVTCPGGVGSYCGSVVGHEEFTFTSQLVFEDRDLQTLTLNDSSSGPNFWNAFEMREMRIGFNNGAFVGAYIPSAAEVPESIGTPMPILAFLFLFWRVAYSR